MFIWLKFIPKKKKEEKKWNLSSGAIDTQTYILNVYLFWL